jgi:hypothetical protein
MPPQRKVKAALLAARDGSRLLGCVGLETRSVRDNQISRYGQYAEMEVRAVSTVYTILEVVKLPGPEPTPG